MATPLAFPGRPIGQTDGPDQANSGRFAKEPSIFTEINPRSSLPLPLPLQRGRPCPDRRIHIHHMHPRFNAGFLRHCGADAFPLADTSPAATSARPASRSPTRARADARGTARLLEPFFHRRILKWDCLHDLRPLRLATSMDVCWISNSRKSRLGLPRPRYAAGGCRAWAIGARLALHLAVRCALASPRGRWVLPWPLRHARLALRGRPATHYPC